MPIARPTGRAPAAIALAALLLLAGCPSVSGPSGSSDPAEPAVSATPTPTPVAPGITVSGVEPERLVAAHERVLSRSSYRLVIAERTVTGDGTDNVLFRARVEPGRYAFDRRGSIANMSVRREQFFNSTAEYRNVSAPDRRYEVIPRREPAADPPTDAETLSQILPLVNYTRAGTRPVNGTHVAVLRARGPTNATVEEGRVTAFKSTLLVDRRGVVRRFRYDVTVETPDGTVRTEHRMRLTGLNATTVEPPAWLSKPLRPQGPVERTLRRPELGASLRVVGDRDTVESVRLERSTAFFLDNDLFDRAGVSTPVTATGSGEGNLSTVEVTLSYNESAIPGGNESGVALFVYDERAQTFLPMVSAVNTSANTVTASRIGNVTITIGTGADAERYEPAIGDLGTRRIFLVMHAETYAEAFEARGA